MAKRDPRRRNVIVLYGEHEHDRQAIRVLIGALRDDLVNAHFRQARSLILMKGASAADLKERRRKLKESVNAFDVRENVWAVVMHEDCDAVEPAHVDLRERIIGSFGGGCAVVAAVPAWEIETWWLLWPSVAPTVNQSWRAPVEYRGRDLGRVEDSKEKLQQAVIPHGLNKKERERFVTYEEADSLPYAQAVTVAGLIGAPEAQSASFDLFVADVAALPKWS